MTLILSPFTQAEDIDRVQVQQWLETEWKAAAVLPRLRDYHLQYEWQQSYVPPDAELSQLRLEVNGHPDHPEKDKLTSYDWIRLHGPLVATIDLWFQDKQNWRFNITWPSDPDKPGSLRWNDECLRGSRAWTYVPLGVMVRVDAWNNGCRRMHRIRPSQMAVESRCRTTLRRFRWFIPEYVMRS